MDSSNFLGANDVILAVDAENSPGTADIKNLKAVALLNSFSLSSNRQVVRFGEIGSDFQMTTFAEGQSQLQIARTLIKNSCLMGALYFPSGKNMGTGTAGITDIKASLQGDAPTSMDMVDDMIEISVKRSGEYFSVALAQGVTFSSSKSAERIGELGTNNKTLAYQKGQAMMSINRLMSINEGSLLYALYGARTEFLHNKIIVGIDEYDAFKTPLELRLRFLHKVDGVLASYGTIDLDGVLIGSDAFNAGQGQNRIAEGVTMTWANATPSGDNEIYIDVNDAKFNAPVQLYLCFLSNNAQADGIQKSELVGLFKLEDSLVTSLSMGMTEGVKSVVQQAGITWAKTVPVNVPQQ